MFTAESPTLPSCPAGDPGAVTSADRASVNPRVRQLCPAGVQPGTPWRNGVVPLVAYVVYTPSHALAAPSCSVPLLP